MTSLEPGYSAAAAAIERITSLNGEIRDFWSSAQGWAPLEASELLTRSRLDWQVSLSRTLVLWLEDADELQRDGRLILAWGNLGALVEGTMMLFLSVYLSDYRGNATAGFQVGRRRDPDKLHFEALKSVMTDVVYRGDWEWSDWIDHIQERRNAIHAFRDRQIGTFSEFHLDVIKYLEFLEDINDQLPYP